MIKGAELLNVSLILSLSFLATPLLLPGRAHGAEPRPFYEGKTITLLISTSPGGATDVAGRLLSRHLTKYIPGHPNIIGQNMPGAGGIVSANYLFNVAKPDGLTLLAVNRANYLDQMVGRPEVKLDFRKLNWIGSFNRAPMMIACRKDTPFTSIENMRAAKTPARFGEGGTGSISYVFSSLVSEILDFKVKHVTGYGSAREIDLGIERGEADCRATSDIALVRPPWPTWVQQNFITFVIQQGPSKSRVLPTTTPTVWKKCSAMQALSPRQRNSSIGMAPVILAASICRRRLTQPSVSRRRDQTDQRHLEGLGIGASEAKVQTLLNHLALTLYFVRI